MLYQQQRSFVNQYRRKTLLSGAAFLAVNFVASPGFACGGGGDGGEQSDEQSSTTKKTPKTKKKKQPIEMSQAKFLRQSTTVISKQKNAASADKIKIEGFSYSGSEILWDMAYSERKLTRKLLKDMAKLKTFNARKAHLRREVHRGVKLTKQLQKEKDNLPKKATPETEKLFSKLFNVNNKSRADEIDAEIKSLNLYGYRVLNWSYNPMDGTLK